MFHIKEHIMLKSIIWSLKTK